MLTLTSFTVLTRFLGFIYKIYLAKIMTTTDLGIYNIALSVYMVILTLVGSSIPLTISRITSRNKTLGKNFESHYSVTSSLIVSTIFSTILCIILCFCKPVINLLVGAPIGYTIIICLLPSIIFTAIYSQIRGYLWGIENYSAVSLVEFYEQIIRIVFSILLVISGIFDNPIYAVCLSLSIACGLSTVIGLIYYLKNGGKFKYQKGYYKEIVQSALPLTCVRLFGSILSPIISIILPYMLVKNGLTREMALSEIGIAMGMTMHILSIPSTIIGSLCMILIPRISGNNNKDDINKQINYYFTFTIACIFIFIPMFFAIGEPACKFVFDNQSAGLYLKYSCWTMVSMGLSQITTTILNAMNKEKTTFIYYVISSLFLILSVIILPKFMGVSAMLYGSGISYIILSILNLRKIKKLTGLKSNISSQLIYNILISVPIILITKYTYNILSKLCGIFIGLSLSSIISIVCYATLLVVFGVMDLKIIKNYTSKFSLKKNVKKLSKN